MRQQLLGISKKAIAGALSFAPEGMKHDSKRLFELLFWKKTLRAAGGTFHNGHMKRAFTEVFGLDASFYDDARILDVGCGPVGTLEWADNARERVGADPLADDYVRLNGGSHAMRYVKTFAEDMPFESGYFDIVTVFNALDHVEDVEASVREICRTVRPGGTLLLIVEIDHKPTITEPHDIGEEILDLFEGFSRDMVKVVAIRDDHNMYQSVFDAAPRKNVGDAAIVIARMTKAEAKAQAA